MLRIALALSLLAGCKKEAPPPVATPTAPAPAAAPQEAIDEMKREFARVQFDFDSAKLVGDSKSALDRNSEIMGQYADIRVEVQGHADERGTTEYNMALGQQRATAVRDYMMAKGVAGTRVVLVSYGEEKPLQDQSTESAWAVNRRAEFKVLSGNAPVSGTTN